MGLQPSALLSKFVGEVLERIKAAIGNGVIGQGPEPFGGLQLWGIRRQSYGFDARCMSLRCRDMEASAVLNNQDVVVLSRTHTLGKGSHDGLIGSLIQDWNQPEAAFPALWIDESVDIEPFVARVDGTDERLSCRCPHRTQNGLQAQTMFIHGPQGDARVEKLRRAELLH